MATEALLDYWFGTDVDDAVVANKKAGLWWKSDPAVDDDLRTRFADLVEKAGRNELGEWASTPRGLLALILLSDSCRATSTAIPRARLPSIRSPGRIAGTALREASIPACDP